jgi:MFS family permease
MDRIGRKPFILLGSLITFFGTLSYSLANTWLLLGAAIIFVSLDFPIRATATSASISDSEKSQRLGEAFSLDMGATQAAATAAPLLGGYVATTFGVSTHALFATSASLVLVAMLIVWFGYRPRPRERAPLMSKEHHKWFVLPDRRIVPALVIVTIDGIAWRISSSFWTLYVFKAMNANQAQLGTAIAIAAGVPAITGFTLGSRLNRANRKLILAVSEWCAIGAFLPLLLGPTPEFAYISAVFVGLVNALWQPSLYAYVIDRFGREKFGQTLGTLTLLSGLASSASPLLGGWLWDNVSPKMPFVVTLVLAIMTGAVVWSKLEDKSNKNLPLEL